MANVNFIRGNNTQINNTPKVDGQLLFNTDNKTIEMDMGSNNRVKVGFSQTELNNLNSRIDNIIAQSGTSSTEVTDARASRLTGTTSASLKARIDNDTKVLDEAIIVGNRGDVTSNTKVFLNSESTEVEVPTMDDFSQLSESITEIKNRLSIPTLEMGTYRESGEPSKITTNQRIRSNDTIDIDSFVAIKLPEGYSGYALCWTKNNDFLGFSGGYVGTIRVKSMTDRYGDNVKKYAVSIRRDSLPTSDISEYLIDVEKNIKYIKAYDKIIECGEVVNPVDTTNVITGGFYNAGVWTPNTSFNSTKLIDCSKYEHVYDTYQRAITFFDEFNQYVSQLVLNGTGDIPPSAKYLAYPVSNAEVTNGKQNHFCMYSGDEIHFVPEFGTPTKIYSSNDTIGNTAWKGKLWYAYGTSMTDYTVDTESHQTGYYAPWLASISGMTCIDRGRGGQGIVPSITGGIKTRVMTLEDGKANADLITVEIIPNDLSAPLGNTTDLGNDTFLGNLAQIIKYLQQNTHAQIVIMCATRQRYENGSYFTPESSATTKRITWENAVDELCMRYGVEFWNGARCGLGYWRMGATDTKFCQDQIHLTSLGGYNLARYYYARLIQLPLFYDAIQ